MCRNYAYASIFPAAKLDHKECSRASVWHWPLYLYVSDDVAASPRRQIPVQYTLHILYIHNCVPLVFNRSQNSGHCLCLRVDVSVCRVRVSSSHQLFKALHIGARLAMAISMATCSFTASASARLATSSLLFSSLRFASRLSGSDCNSNCDSDAFRDRLKARIRVSRFYSILFDSSLLYSSPIEFS